MNPEEAVGDEIVECEMIFFVHASPQRQGCFYCGELNLITEMVSLVVINRGRLIGPRTLCTVLALILTSRPIRGSGNGIISLCNLSNAGDGEVYSLFALWRAAIS